MGIKNFESFISNCLQGCGVEAMRTAKKIALTQLNNKQSSIIKAFRMRFAKAKQAQNKLSKQPIKKIITIYENYWRGMFFEGNKKAYFETKLRDDIKNWLKIERKVLLKTPSLDKTTERLKIEIESMGYGCITGKVLPFYELEIWRKQKAVVYSVKLIESYQKVKVFMMSHFVSKGWMAYLTMGHIYPGGWAKKEGLYCNANSYNLTHEAFKVSYLVHEAQHYADYKKYPKLQQIDLEYRAKLSEFIMSKHGTKKLFTKFSSRAEYNKNSPHAFANYCVLRDLTQEIYGHENFNSVVANIKKLKTNDVRAAAHKLLLEHSVRLKKKGPASVRALIV